MKVGGRAIQAFGPILQFGDFHSNLALICIGYLVVQKLFCHFQLVQLEDPTKKNLKKIILV